MKRRGIEGKVPVGPGIGHEAEGEGKELIINSCRGMNSNKENGRARKKRMKKRKLEGEKTVKKESGNGEKTRTSK